MSSTVEADGRIVATAVTAGAAAGAAIVLGAGWAAWKTGTLLVKVNDAINDEIAKEKQKLKEAERHRKMIAVSAHSQLADICASILSRLETISDTGSIVSSAEIEHLKSELKSICEETLPDDITEIERLTSLGYIKLNKIIQKQNKIAFMSMVESRSGRYHGQTVAELMDDIRLVVGTMSVKVTKGHNIVATDHDVLERKKLNEEFTSVTAEIMVALETVEKLSEKHGLSASANAWFKSCFNGIDEQIEVLCRPTTSNQELEKGIKRLRDVVEQYEMMAASIEKDLKRMEALYEVYVDASKALGEVVEDFSAFKDSAAIEKKLRYLQKRAVRAQECAEIYEKIGSVAYICYAWDQELKAMGYNVQTRQDLAKMETFNKWKNSDLTQLYSISSKCSLQVIVHRDGTVSMQTIAAEEDEDVIHTQQNHCSQLKKLRERLRKNWFILYDFNETKSPEVIKTVTEWIDSESGVKIEDRRLEGKTVEKIQKNK